LTGDFYRFLYQVEGLDIDQSFIQNTVIEWECEGHREEINQNKIVIRQLTEENERLRRRLSEFELNFNENWEGKYWGQVEINKKFQNEIQNYITIIENLRNENKRLVEINININNQLSQLQLEIKNINIQINIFGQERDEWRSKYERHLVVFRELEQQFFVVREQRNKIEYIEKRVEVFYFEFFFIPIIFIFLKHAFSLKKLIK